MGVLARLRAGTMLCRARPAARAAASVARQRAVVAVDLVSTGAGGGAIEDGRDELDRYNQIWSAGGEADG